MMTEVATAQMEAMTVDAGDGVMRHPSYKEGHHMLESAWSVWWDQGRMGATDYSDHLKNLGSFRTVEEFWSMYTSLSRPNHLHHMSHYRVFREGVLPMWEACPTGGSWIVRFKKQGKQHKSSPTLAKCWEELLFATVGEFFEDPDVIGIVVGIKTTEDVLQVWNRDNSGGMGVARKIGNLLKDLLGKHLDHHNTMEYKECSSAVKGCKSPDGTKASPWLAAAAAKEKGKGSSRKSSGGSDHASGSKAAAKVKPEPEEKGAGKAKAQPEEKSAEKVKAEPEEKSEAA